MLGHLGATLLRESFPGPRYGQQKDGGREKDLLYVGGLAAGEGDGGEGVAR